MIVCRLGATMGPVGLWASGWLCSKSVIEAPAATPPVGIVSLPTLLVSVTVSVFMEQGRYPCAQPPNWRTRGITLCLVSTLRPFRHKLPNQDCKAPTDIALGVIETSKQLHQDKSNKVRGDPIGSVQLVKKICIRKQTPPHCGCVRSLEIN